MLGPKRLCASISSSGNRKTTPISPHLCKDYMSCWSRRPSIHGGCAAPLRGRSERCLSPQHPYGRGPVLSKAHLLSRSPWSDGRRMSKAAPSASAPQCDRPASCREARVLGEALLKERLPGASRQGWDPAQRGQHGRYSRLQATQPEPPFPSGRPPPALQGPVASPWQGVALSGERSRIWKNHADVGARLQTWKARG